MAARELEPGKRVPERAGPPPTIQFLVDRVRGAAAGGTG